MPHTDEELRDGGWSEAEIRDYRRGVEAVSETFAKASFPGATSPAQRPDRPRVVIYDALPQGGRNRDYEAWRQTPAGRIHSLAYPNPSDGYAEQSATAGPEQARVLAEAYEVTYGRRPDIRAVQATLNAGGWQRGQGFEGTAQDLCATTRWTFPDWVIKWGAEDIGLSTVTTHPETPEGYASMVRASLGNGAA